jgi:hypothetical protein
MFKHILIIATISYAGFYILDVSFFQMFVISMLTAIYDVLYSIAKELVFVDYSDYEKWD